MYNQGIKEKFIQELTANGKSVKSVSKFFEGIGKIEESKNMDIALMGKDDFLFSLQSVESLRYTSAYTRLDVARNYVKWCIKNNVFCDISTAAFSTKIDEIDISEALKDILFTSEQELIHALRTVREFDDGYYEVIAAMFAWYGISKQQMLDIKISDVDLDHGFIFVDELGYNVPISETSAEILRTYAGTKTATRVAGGSVVRTVYRNDSYDLFLRKFLPRSQLVSKITQKNLDDTMSIMNRAYINVTGASRLTISNILDSGALYRVRILEQDGVDVFNPKHKEEILKAYRKKAKLHEVLWQYRNYKKAFNL